MLSTFSKAERRITAYNFSDINSAIIYELVELAAS